MANDMITQTAQDSINARILARQAKSDFRRIEAASRKIPMAFHSPEVKRLYVRYFNQLQLHAHFISVIARTRLAHAVVEKVEADLQQRMEQLSADVDKAIAGAEALCAAHGISRPATYDTEPLHIEVRVISTFGRRYLELLSKVDQLMPLLETLAIDDVIALRELDKRKAQFKRAARQAAGAARNFKSGLQQRMNALTKEDGGNGLETTQTPLPVARRAEEEGAEQQMPLLARNESPSGITEGDPTVGDYQS